MRSLVAGSLTAAALGAILVVGSRGVGPGRPGRAAVDEAIVPVETPAEDAVRALIGRGDAGDVDAYLDAFTGHLRDALERRVASEGREAFGAHLRKAASARQGHAVFAAEFEGPDAAKVEVEVIYRDSNERQTYRVVPTPDGWKVAEVAARRARIPSARFGDPTSPVTAGDADPHGPLPPQVGLTVEGGDEPAPP